MSENNNNDGLLLLIILCLIFPPLVGIIILWFVLTGLYFLILGIGALIATGWEALKALMDKPQPQPAISEMHRPLSEEEWNELNDSMMGQKPFPNNVLPFRHN